MIFDDILAQVLALLQREQRLSYRTLQRQFALEEADLEALKDELIYAKRLAVRALTQSCELRVGEHTFTGNLRIFA